MGPARTFEPKHALIVQNKDEVTLPLLLETLPTPKAFRDAIASLSPEQQRFARSYRAMQVAARGGAGAGGWGGGERWG